MIADSSKKTILLFSLVIILCLTTSIISSVFLFRYTKEQNRIRIERYFEDRAENLQLNINNTLQALDSLAGLFYSIDTVKRMEFDKFVSLNLNKESSIISLAWIPYISHEYRKEFQKNISGPGMRGRFIYDLNSHGITNVALNQNYYYPVKYLYSKFNTILFPGLNLGTQYKTRKKLEESAVENKTLVTNGIRLQRGKPGLIIVRAFRPVYDSKFKAENNIKGFVMAQIDIDYLMKSTFGGKEDLSILLFDVNSALNKQLLYSNHYNLEQTGEIQNINQLGLLEETYWTRYYNVGDRKWLISFIEPRASSNQSLWLPFLSFLVGLIFTAFLMIYMLVAWSRKQEVLQLKQESDAKSRFLQAIGHDLRQPLNIISLHITEFEEKHKSSIGIENKSLIKNIRESVRGLHNMFTSILDITRLDVGMTKPEFTEVSLLQLITDLGDEFDMLAVQKGP